MLRTFGAAPATGLPELAGTCHSPHALRIDGELVWEVPLLSLPPQTMPIRYAPVAMRMRSKSLLHGHAPLVWLRPG